ncbi:MAG: hypothetical protein CL479_04945 [Acidobacteria bacterium]|nr:hypothetical protein [Acidobacteriota bacterium]|tara:strand:- start:65 stop:493 length:429 start_codon:yes stop_codon:yes gene_type:complete
MLDLTSNLQKSAQLVTLYLDKFRRDYGITQPEAHVLAVLHVRGETSIRSLHHTLGHKPSTLTSILDRLVARGFITRETSRTDRRSFDIKLTLAGTIPAVAIRTALHALENKIVRRSVSADIRGITRIASTLEELIVDTRRAG